MKSIWKYDLDTVDVQIINMPNGADILSVQVQHGVPRIWAMVEKSNHIQPRKIITKGTGHDAGDITDSCSFIGTYQLHGGAIVFHVFEDAVLLTLKGQNQV